ncbi:hypothetical protein ACKFKF_09725 [Phormidesmis sp. 146-12]
MVLPNSQPIDALDPQSRNQLIQSYAKMLYSKLWRSPIAAQRILKQEWQGTFAVVQARFPNLDLTQPEVLKNLEQRAYGWWTVKGVKGKDIDW